MSMNGYFRTASDATIERLKSDPEEVPAFLGLDGDEAFGAFGRAPAPFLRLVRDGEEGADDTPSRSTATSARSVAGEGETLDLEKSWHGIHFLLNGSPGGGAPPLAFLVEGGEEIGEDLGYGPARALSSGQLRDFSIALNRISDAELRRRFDPRQLERAGIYPNIWDEGDEAFDWLATYFGELRSFVTRAAKNGMGAIAYMM